MNITTGLEIHHDGDLPARSGLGSSSSFTVGLLQALYALKGEMVTKKRLALESIHIEQEMINEHVGSQDQVAAAFGGFNKITFNGNHNIDVVPIAISDKKLQKFQSHLMLFFTGFQRNASEIEGKKIKQIKKKKANLELMRNMVDEAIKILNEGDDISDFGKMLHENWKLKKSLTEDVSTDTIDDIYDTAVNNGAIGGKILGAGRGGFVIFFVKPEDQERLRIALSNLLYVPFKLDTTGSQIIFYSRSGV
jgi:D-glycero-alpha-D-manno-heptose-7-phosphate kinase